MFSCPPVAFFLPVLFLGSEYDLLAMINANGVSLMVLLEQGDPFRVMVCIAAT